MEPRNRQRRRRYHDITATTSVAANDDRNSAQNGGECDEASSETSSSRIRQQRRPRPPTRFESFRSRHRATNPVRYYGILSSYALLVVLYCRVLLFGNWGRTMLRPVESLPTIPPRFYDMAAVAQTDTAWGNNSMGNISSTRDADSNVKKVRRLIDQLPPVDEMVRSVEQNGVDPRGLASVKAWNGWAKASHGAKIEIKRMDRLEKNKKKKTGGQHGGGDEEDADIGEKGRSNRRGADAAAFLLTNGTSIILNATGTRRRTTNGSRRKQKQKPSRLAPFLLLLMCCTWCRSCQHCLLHAYADVVDQDLDDTAFPAAFAAAIRDRASRVPRVLTNADMTEIDRRTNRALLWTRLRWLTRRLNAVRAQNGRAPISAEALLVVLNDGDSNNGDDFEALLELDEENVPLESSSTGASEEEIARCPDRVIDDAGDDLMSGGPDGMAQNCTICLHPFQLGDRVRTTACFHSFHIDCIDPWLRRKAECPICKQRAIPTDTTSNYAIPVVE